MSETVRDRPMVVWNVNRKSWITNRSVSVPMTWGDLVKRDVMVNFFQADVLSNVRTV